MRGISGTYLANFHFSQIQWVKSRSIMKVSGKCPLNLIMIKVSLYMLLQSLTKMMPNYILCITCVYPHKTLLLAYTDISCPYSISAFESLSNSDLSDNHVSCVFYRSHCLMSHGTKKMDKNVRHPYTTSISVSRVSPSFFNKFTGYDLEKTTTTRNPKQTKKPKLNQNKQKTRMNLRAVFQL